MYGLYLPGCLLVRHSSDVSGLVKLSTHRADFNHDCVIFKLPPNFNFIFKCRRARHVIGRRRPRTRCDNARTTFS